MKFRNDSLKTKGADNRLYKSNIFDNCSSRGVFKYGKLHCNWKLISYSPKVTLHIFNVTETYNDFEKNNSLKPMGRLDRQNSTHPLKCYNDTSLLITKIQNLYKGK